MALPLAAAQAEDANPPPPHPVWTLVPTHIDRDKEQHVRLAPRPEEDAGDMVLSPDHPIRIGPEGTFNVEGKPTQIFGMVLPDRQTLCTTPTGARWACGVRAVATFVSLLAGHKLSCDRVSPIGTTITVVTCKAGNEDIAERMIGDGWAVADERAGVKLKSLEDAARKDLRGRWRTTIPDL